jgi:hypothetical protein
MNPVNEIVWDLVAFTHPETQEKAHQWVADRSSEMVAENKQYGLKVGDTIKFWTGYNRDILASSEILGFYADDGKAIIIWDCYWFPVDLEQRLVK